MTRTATSRAQAARHRSPCAATRLRCLTRIATALLLPIGLLGPAAPAAFAAETPAVEALLERARLWASRDRPELAREALQRLERVEPDNAQALALQAELDIRAGELGAAQAALERLRARDARHPEIRRIEALLRLEGSDKAKLRDARLMAKAGRSDAAVDALRVLFNNDPPSAELALEYWQLVALTSNGWAPAHAGLSRVAQQLPENLRARFALAEHELSRSPINLAALRRVVEMAKLPEFSRPAMSAWRRAMLRLDPQPQSLALLRDYLAADAADNTVRERLETLGAAVERRNRLLADPAYQAGQQGLAALEQGDLVAAEARLLQSLAARPEDGEVLGALGSVRLRQGRHGDAQELFDRAAQQDRERASKWRSLSRTAQLWGALRASDEALDRGDAAAAEQLASAALRLDAREPEALLALGRAVGRQGQAAQAEAHFRSALRIEPTHAGAFRALAALLIERGDDAGLDRLFASLTPAQRNAFAKPIEAVQRDRQRDEARRLEEAGRTAEAMVVLQQLVELDGSDPWLRYALAKLHADQGAPQRGRALLTAMAHAQRPDAEALHALALYESRLGDDLAALGELERIALAERTASMVRTQRRLWFGVKFRQAELAAQGGQRRHVRALLGEAQAAARGDFGLTLDVAEAWAGAREPVAALALLDSLRWTSASPVAARLRQAALLRQAGAFDALPPVLDAIAAAPGKTEAQQGELDDLRDAWALQQAGVLRAQGKEQEALDLLQARLEARPTRMPLLLAHAEQLRANGRSNESIPLYRRALALDPREDDAYRALVETLMGAGERAEAQRLIVERLSRGGDPAAEFDTQIAMAGALIELGRFEAARQALDELVGKAPGHARAWRVLAELDLRDGQAERAIERLRHAAVLDAQSRAAAGTLRPISRVALRMPTDGSTGPAQLQLTHADASAARAESGAWRPQRAMAGWIEQQSPEWSGALDWRWRSGTDGLSSYQIRELPIEYARAFGADARIALRVDLAQIDAGSVDLADTRRARDFGSLLLCQPGCTIGSADQTDAGLSFNAAYRGDRLQADVGVTPIGFAVVRPVGGLRVKGELGAGSYSLDLSSRPVTSSVLSYAGTRDPRTGQVWGGVQASGLRLGLSRDDGLAFGAWSSIGLHLLHGRKVQDNLRQRAMGGVYWRAINEDHRVLSVGVNAMLQAFRHNAGEFTFGHGGYYSPQSYRSLSLPVSFALREGRWSYSVRASLSRSRSRTDSAPYYPNDPAMQAAAEALAAAGGVDPRYDGGRSSGSGYSLAAAVETQLSPRLFAGARLEIERSEDYSPNRALIYLRFTPAGAALRPLAMPPEAVIPTSEF